MCMNLNAMDSVVDQCGNTDSPEQESNLVEKCIETENIFLNYLKSLMLVSFNVDAPVENILPEYDGSESGLEAIDNLCDLLVSLCETSSSRNDPSEETLDVDKNKKHDPRNKRTLKCLSSHYGKELQVKPNRARSHSSVGVDEILRTQELIDLNSTDSRRKSRRVSLGMRPKFSNWSKVKGAFKRDKSNSRIDSRDEYPDTSCSGDESTEKNELLLSSSHENVNQLSSDEDEEFEYYPDGYDKSGISFQVGDVRMKDNAEYNKNAIPKSKSAIIPQIYKSYNSLSTSHSSHKNPFKWYKSKSGNVSASENGVHETLSPPPSPYKTNCFLYDEDSINKINDEHSGNSGNEAQTTPSGDILLDVQNKYESLQKKLSREFHERYHDWRRAKEIAGNNEDDEKYPVLVDETKLSPILVDQSFSPGFKQKLQEWQKIKGLSLSPTRSKSKSDNVNPLKKSKSDWHKWKPGKSDSNVLRLVEKDEGGSTCGECEDTSVSLNYSKIQSGLPNIDILKCKMNQPIEKKELAWLEKELQKVAREKQRLEKEKEKYAERETRLRNMKRAIKSGRKRKQEVLVPTSAGLFRFQGISSKFTKKLYEWEKAKGIAAESSTFALLDSYLGGSDSQWCSKLQNLDQLALLSRSRSVGSVEVAGVGSSLLNSNSMSRQQSSLSLNDMEQLEEAHLQVENDNLMQSTSQLFDKDNDNEFDLISNESLIIPDYSKSSTSHSIPLLSSSVKSSPEKDTNLNEMHSSTYSKQSNESGDISESYGSGSHFILHPSQTDANYMVSSDLEQRKSANADARSIVDEIKKLRARTSIDDEDRINILTNLQILADQLVNMVHSLNSKKNENTDELAEQIADLAITLKKKIKRLTTDELHTSLSKNSFPSDRDSNETFPVDSFNYLQPEDISTDTEDNESPTVHCTFTLPSWRTKYTTPSSTESESCNIKNKYVDTRQSKNDRPRKHFTDDHSSGNDENYDGSDETTLYLDLKCVKNKPRRESSDNISTSNSDSFVYSEKEKPRKIIKMPELDDHEILHCILSLDGDDKKELKERKLNLKETSSLNKINDDEKELGYEQDRDESPLKHEIRSYSPKPLSSKRKCSSCGKIKRISKSRKLSSTSYCCCRKDNLKTDAHSEDPRPTNFNNLSSAIPKDDSFQKTNSYLNNSHKVGKIARSKVYDFNVLKQSEKFDPESDVHNEDKSTINVIVPTTRKIFAPLSRNESGAASAVVSYTIDDSSYTEGKSEDNDSKSLSPPYISDLKLKSVSPSIERKTTLPTRPPPIERNKAINLALELHGNTNKLPPASPLSPKRNVNKDNNSSIRMMIAHYNKLTSENPDKKPLDSNCWMSSLQKSPVMERRSRFESANENDKSIRKSKSAVLTKKKSDPKNYENKSENADQFTIVKSSSAGSIRFSPFSNPETSETSRHCTQSSNFSNELRKNSSSELRVENINQPIENISHNQPINQSTSLTFPSTALERNQSFESVLSETKLRSLKLQEAKHKFFNDFPPKGNQSVRRVEVEVEVELATTPTSEPDTTLIQENLCNVEDNSFMALNKSVSTGAIYERRKNCNTPINEKTGAKSKFGFSSIASKFRKVKMRRHKDPEVSAVSSLCRASLSMNIDKEGKQKECRHSSKSCPSSPVMQRSFSKRNSSSN